MIDVALFAEDEGHRALLPTLIRRIAEDESVGVRLKVRQATGGAGSVLSSLRLYARDLRRGVVDYASVLVVAVDGDDYGRQSRTRQVKKALGEEYPGVVVLAIPEPHVERWYLLDPQAVGTALGLLHVTQLPALQHGPRVFKDALRQAFLAVNVDPPAGGIEYGRDIAEVMDLSAACHQADDFDAFVTDLRASLRLSSAGASE